MLVLTTSVIMRNIQTIVFGMVGKLDQDADWTQIYFLTKFMVLLISLKHFDI